jgi:hypothetical protein
MKCKTSFVVELAQEGEGVVVFKFKTPRLNDLYKDQESMAKLGSDDPAVKSAGEGELLKAIISRCQSVTGLTDEDGNELGAGDIGDLPISALGALIAAYHQGSVEAVGITKKPKAASEDAASA